MASSFVSEKDIDRRFQINENLIKIKQERESADHSISSYDSSDMSHIYEDFSQAPKPQRFYQDLDNILSNLTRDQYMNQLIHYCNGDEESVNDYRCRLAERARGFPECPETRLVNRRNTANNTKLEKCASDCYILNMFNNGDRSKDINDVFTAASNMTMNDSVARSQQRHYGTNYEDSGASNMFALPDNTATLI